MEYKEIVDGWKVPTPASNETARLSELYRLEILDSEPEHSFDRITQLVASTLNVPICLVSLIEDDRQWFKSAYGLDVCETTRDQSFCDHAIRDCGIMIVPDATKDDRFRGNTLVTGGPKIRFYAGMPLVTKSGYGLGALCAIDTVPRKALSKNHRIMMETLADTVVDLLELRLVNKYKEKASQAKSAFLSGMSHEIRTPMNGIIGAANLLKHTTLDDKQNKYVDIINGSGHLLLDIINEVLDFSKIESGRLELNESVFNLKKTMEEQVEMMSPLGQEKGIACTYDASDTVPDYIRGDETRMRQVLMNLIGNAIKFTPRDGSVTVRVTKKPDDDGQDILFFEIIDTGIGIPKEKQRLIFAPFEQIKTGAQKDEETRGTGLGLSICARLVDLMDGEIGVESEEGKGSRFWFTVPCKEEQAPESSGQAQPLSDIDVAQMTAGMGHILLVENEMVNQMVATDLLEGLGCVVDLAENGAEAVEMVQDYAYDLVLMDCMMPVMDGYEATRTIRGLNIKQPKIVALTANAFEEDRKKCLDAGMDDFLRKPLEEADVIKVLYSAAQQVHA